MAFIARGGQNIINVLAGQSLIVGSFGAGQSKVSVAPNTALINAIPTYVLTNIISGGSVVIPFAVASSVQIEASNACEAEYDFGMQPCLTFTNYSAVNGIVARAGGGQALATPLNANINRVTTVAAINDSVLLPSATLSRIIYVQNAGVNSMNVFPQSGESIGNGGAFFAVPSGKTCIFICSVVGNWGQILGA